MSTLDRWDARLETFLAGSTDLFTMTVDDVQELHDFLHRLRALRDSLREAGCDTCRPVLAEQLELL